MSFKISFEGGIKAMGGDESMSGTWKGDTCGISC